MSAPACFDLRDWKNRWLDNHVQLNNVIAAQGLPALSPTVASRATLHCLNARILLLTEALAALSMVPVDAQDFIRRPELTDLQYAARFAAELALQDGSHACILDRRPPAGRTV